MSVDLAELTGALFDEANEHVATMESTLLALEQDPSDRELLNAIFRAAHSIKGAAGIFGYTDLLHFTHALEGLLHLLRSGSIEFSPPLPDLLFRSTDALRGLVDSTRLGQPPSPILGPLVHELDAAARRASADASEASPAKEAAAQALPAAPEQPVTRAVRVRFAPGRELLRMGMDPLLVLRDLFQLGTADVCLEADALPPIDELDPESSYLAWTITLQTDKTEADIRDVFAFVEDVSQVEVTVAQTPTAEPSSSPQPSAAAEAANPAPAFPVAPEPPAPQVTGARPAAVDRSTVRVDTSKLDRLIDLVGELVIAQSMVTAALDDGKPGAQARLREAILAMDRNTRELQDRVMAVRMLPLGSVLHRFPRMVRDLCGTLKKKVDLVVVGDDVELDKGVIEKLSDPLTHLVRNAIDHGFELPEERLAAGKPEEGRLSITAYHQGGNVLIEVADDGRGLPREKIRDKARALGLLPKDVEPTAEELHAVVFAPGFSSKDEVTDVSGRGVGMDVVKRNVESMSGSLQFTSEPGKGSKLRIRLPLTMAIIDGLTLRIGEQIFVMPLVEVVESLRPTHAQFQTVLGRGEVIRVRNSAIPLVRLHERLGIRGAQTDPCQALVCIVETHGSLVGFLVDEIVGQAQVVVKTLETNYRRIDGVTGATILGDGHVALILDAQALARRPANSHSDKETFHGAAGNAA